MKRPRFLCDKPTTDGPCWRLSGHQGKCVNQRHQVPADRPLAVVSEGGVLVASYQAYRLSRAQSYVRFSGGHVVDVRAWEIKA